MKQSTLEVFLDLDPEGDITEESAASAVLDKFQPIISSIGKRKKQINNYGVFYDTLSVAMYDQAKDLFCLGYFVPTITICRSTAEYLAYEIFYEEIDLEGNSEVISSVAENLDFRKIVNEFLYNPSKNFKIIDKESCDLFNKLYSLGNIWIHPRRPEKSLVIEAEALKAIHILGKLFSSLRNVMKDYEVKNGILKKTPNGRIKKRAIRLGAGR